MTEHLSVDGGTIAYDVTGDPSAPLIVLAHGIGNSREAYRFVVPALAAAGYRVAAMDLRGCGESSMGWTSYTHTDLANDMIALVNHLGGPAVLVGHSISGGAVTLAAVKAPSLITAVIELAPFTRKLEYSIGALMREGRYRRGTLSMGGTMLLGSVGLWKRYLENAYPGQKPADWDADLARTLTKMREPGRMKVLQAMCKTPPVEPGKQLANIQCPVLVVEGTLDPDWASPQAEGEGIVAAVPAGLGRLEMIPGAGHYPHAQFPTDTVTAMLTFLSTVRA